MDYQQPYQSLPGSTGPGMPAPGMGGPGLPAEKSGKKGKRSADKAPTKKLFTRQFMLAGLCALVAAGVIFSFLSASKNTGNYVVVASGPIAAGTHVTPGMLAAVKIPTGQQVAGAVTDADGSKAITEAATALKNVVSQFQIAQNQQIVPSQFGPIENLGTALAPNERLVSFQAGVSASVAGSIQSGDHVDIYATNSTIAGLLVANVPIVSVTVSQDQYNNVASTQAANKNARPQDLLPGDPVPGTYVARVDSSDVAKIVAADAGGKIYLVYRPTNASDSAATGATSVQQALCASGTADPAVCK